MDCFVACRDRKRDEKKQTAGRGIEKVLEAAMAKR